MARKKNNVNFNDIEQGYNIIKKYWKILRSSCFSINNCFNCTYTTRIYIKHRFEK